MKSLETRRRLGAVLLAALLAGCAASPPASQEVASSPWARTSGVHAVAWSHKTFPGKTPSRFAYVHLDGRDAMAVHADASASMLRQVVRVEPDALGRVRFSWKVPALIPGSDQAASERDDAPVRVLLAFDGDRSRLDARDTALSELARVLTGEDMPYATLMYVWCNHRAPGTVIPSPRTSRIRKLVVESGPARLGQWLEYERDIRADYERVFGEPPGPLIGVAIMTDSDNTHSRTQAWYGPVRLLAPAR
jgi:hypothetical protein